MCKNLADMQEENIIKKINQERRRLINATSFEYKPVVAVRQ
jgi:hypothetical protein